MAVLNSWQRLDRVISGKPFGDGADGAYSSATIPSLTYDSCSGSATSTTLTTAGSTFANGDILLIHQTRGTGVGQWEINKVSSGGGSASLTLQEALHYTYTDSGASQAQAVKIPQYTNVTVESGTWTVTAWDANKYGIIPIACNETLTVTGTTTAAGATGNGPKSGAGYTTVVTGGGFRGGRGINSTSYPVQAEAGEGSAGDIVAQETANGSGGGGGRITAAKSGMGGAGGHAASGEAGIDDPATGFGGDGGGTSGAADLTSMTFGGAGGGKAKDSTDAGGGGNGGGIIIFFAKTVAEITGAISVNGGNGGYKDGGGGAGGSVLIVCGGATLGTNKITAVGGTNSGDTTSGGDGSVGRIAVHHSGTVTGTTSPTFEDVSDGTLIEAVEAVQQGYSYFM